MHLSYWWSLVANVGAMFNVNANQEKKDVVYLHKNFTNSETSTLNPPINKLGDFLSLLLALVFPAPLVQMP